MKLNAFAALSASPNGRNPNGRNPNGRNPNGRNGSRSLLLVPLAALALSAVSLSPSYAGAGKDTKAKLVAPNVTLPYTFVCPDCGMKITIKTPADWNKDCLTCACNKTNLGCYHDKKKSASDKK